MKDASKASFIRPSFPKIKIKKTIDIAISILHVFHSSLSDACVCAARKIAYDKLKMVLFSNGCCCLLFVFFPSSLFRRITLVLEQANSKFPPQTCLFSSWHSSSDITGSLSACVIIYSIEYIIYNM